MVVVVLSLFDCCCDPRALMLRAICTSTPINPSRPSWCHDFVGFDLVSTWYRLGVHLVSTWCPLVSTGFDLVSTGVHCGFDLVSTWFRH